MTSPPQLNDRSHLLARLSASPAFDLLIIGGGATGLGLALDASLRGLSVALLEAEDFAKATSSRATKLIHGGVRYLAQGNVGLVRQALHERRTLLRNAPHVVGKLGFVMPSYQCWETPFYGLGLKAYDVLAGRDGLGATELLSHAQVTRLMPGVMSTGLKAGIRYWDGQFDDARLALLLARTAVAEGALLLNYCRVDTLLHQGGRVVGATATDAETGQVLQVRAQCIVNATGVWVDRMRQCDAQALGKQVDAVVAPSQGAHVVVDADFLPGGQALLIPRTSDGRILFAVPWLGKLILGTTDTPRDHLALEPRPQAHEVDFIYEIFFFVGAARPQAHEVDFILAEAARYLKRAPTRQDVRSVWAGLRPLARQNDDASPLTASLSREHKIQVSPSGLVTVTGGKWTTYRVMAEDVLSRCTQRGLLPALPRSITAGFPLLGARPGQARNLAAAPDLAAYGDEADDVQALARPGEAPLADGLTPAMVRFAIRHEYARRVEDVLARRSRLLFLDARLAASLAHSVAAIMQEEGIQAPDPESFIRLARNYEAPAETGEMPADVV